MLRHGVGGEEVRRAPLDEHALQGIVVVRHPELVEVRHQAVVRTAAARSAVLNDDVGVLGADAFKNRQQTQMVINVKIIFILFFAIVLVWVPGLRRSLC